MSMNKKFLCPNCGKSITFSRKTNPIVCPECKSGLLWDSNSKLILANPIRTYLGDDPADTHADRANLILDQRPPQLSKERMEKAAFHAGERIAHERKINEQGLFSGLGTLTAGGLILLIVGAQWGLGKMNWFEFVGIGIGIILVGLGMFITIWFAFALRPER